MTKLIALGGPTGAGKTTLAHNLAREAPALRGALVLDNDLVRRELRAHDLHTIMQDADYTPEVTAQVRARLDELTRAALRQGRDVIDSSGFWGPEARAHIEKLAAECGATFIGLWLDVPREVLIARINERLAARRDSPVLWAEKGHASDACVAVLDKYAALMPPTTPEGWHPIDASGAEGAVREKASHHIEIQI